MLRQRVLTALILAPLAVAAILWLPSFWFALLLGAIVLLGAREMAALGGLKALPAQLAYVGAVALALWWVATGLGEAEHLGIWQLVSGLWVLLTIGLLAWRRPLQPVLGVRPGMLLLGAVLLVSAWLAVRALHAADAQGPARVLFLFVLIWLADSGAYFAGRAFGRHKLTPMVSPGKTWEGVAGALLATLVAAWVLVSLQLTSLSYPIAAALCVVVAMVSVGGDLFESLLKRQAQVKDSGNLLPGHGGALDRIDSLISASPVFVLGLAMLETVFGAVQ